jgi:hypothetical protein
LPEAIESCARIGVDRRRLSRLAAMLLVGAAGVAVGFVWPTLGVVLLMLAIGVTVLLGLEL